MRNAGVRTSASVNATRGLLPHWILCEAGKHTSTLSRRIRYEDTLAALRYCPVALRCEARMSGNLERAIHLWQYRLIYADARGYYRWSRRAALPPGARAGRIATPYSGLLKRHFTSSSEVPRVAKQPSLFA